MIGDLEQDIELNVMTKAYKLIKKLGDEEQGRVIQWLAGKFGVPQTGLSGRIDNVSLGGSTINAALSGSGSAKLGRRSSVEAVGNVEAIVTELTNYSIQGLFERVKTKTDVARVLLVAAYLQERTKGEELGSRAINKELKSVGRGIKNITQTINSLLKKEPSLLVITQKTTTSQQGKKKCRVTPIGLEKVKESLVSGVLKV